MAKSLTVEQQALEIGMVCANQAISRMELEYGYGGRFEARGFWAANMDALVMQVVGYLATDHITTTVIEYPRDWWEAVKARFAPRWVMDRWPVRMARHEVRLDAFYPKFPLPEKFGPYIRVVRHDGPLTFDPDE